MSDESPLPAGYCKLNYQHTADWLWAALIKRRDPRCVVCGRTATDAHHVLLRRYWCYRYDLDNGVGLCRVCHDRAHHNRTWLHQQLECNRPYLSRVLQQRTSMPIPIVTATHEWWSSQIRRLGDEWDDDMAVEMYLGSKAHNLVVNIRRP